MQKHEPSGASTSSWTYTMIVPSLKRCTTSESEGPEQFLALLNGRIAEMDYRGSEKPERLVRFQLRPPFARVAQLTERWSYKPEVEGLSPSSGTRIQFTDLPGA